MAKPKVLSLIEALTPGEEKTFNNQLKQKDKKLSKLFNVLCTYKEHNWSEDYKKSIYENLYKEKYSKKYDYLLRNMFRNLAEKIEEFLIEQEFENELHNNLNLKNYLLLKSLHNRKLFHLFELKFPPALKKAEKSLDFQMASAICSLSFNNYALHYLPNVKNLKKARELNNLYMSYLSSFYLNAYLQGKYNQLLVDNKQGHKNKALSNNDTGMSELLQQSGNPYSKYLKLKALLFTADTEEKIKILRQCLDILKAIDPENKKVREELLFCHSTLALEYSLEGYYDKADELYKKIFAKKEHLKSQVEKSGFCDYLVNLIKSGKYKTVLELIDIYQEDFKNDENHRVKINLLQNAAYAFTGNYKKLFENLPHNFKGLPNYLKHAYRFFFCISFYLRRDYEDALRECNNFKSTIKNKSNDHGEFNVKDVINFFNKFFYIIVQQNNKNSELLYQKLYKLNLEIDEYSKYIDHEIKDYLPLVWLRHEIGKIISEYNVKPDIAESGKYETVKEKQEIPEAKNS